ncbi:phosphatidate cytidylyltransferase [Puia sp. P3]|uniref:phosphatidate cytidylyltransferase n=1 Tax=Puia sp. P3 TaxID=3423952 RepID=UPI003D6673B9
MNNLTQRTITGAALALIITFLLSWKAGGFILLVLTLNLLTLLEFYRLFHAAGLRPIKTGGILLSTLMIMTCALTISKYMEPKILLVNIPIAFGIFIAELFRREPNPFHNLAFTFLGILCITVPLCFFVIIAYLPVGSGLYHPNVALGYFLILWADDSAAYFTGKAFGAHPLFQRVSPRKTWEGSIGGAACALLVAYLVSLYFSGQHMMVWMGMAMTIVVTGTFGDLIKSLMKRSLNIKDSGTILPGHGGMLDRFDSLLGSAPFVFCYFVLLDKL